MDVCYIFRICTSLVPMEWNVSLWTQLMAPSGIPPGHLFLEVNCEILCIDQGLFSILRTLCSIPVERLIVDTANIKDTFFVQDTCPILTSHCGLSVLRDTLYIQDTCSSPILTQWNLSLWTLCIKGHPLYPGHLF